MAALAEVHCRASDADRDRAVRALQRGLVEGRLSYDSFIDRVEVALRAREDVELADVLSGLPGGPRQWLRGRWRRLATRWADAPLDPIELPGRAQPALLIGRDRAATWCSAIWRSRGGTPR